MSAEDRREREKLQMRQKIMDAAREMFARDGYEAVSMRKIAEVIEYSPTTIYLHFADKRELMHAICVEDFASFGKTLAKLAKVENPLDMLHEIGQAYIKFGLKHPNHYRLMFMTEHDVEMDEADRKRQGNPDEDGYAFLKVCVQRAIDAGLLREPFDDVQLAAQTLWAGVHGVVSLEIVKCDDPWMDWRPIEKRTRGMLEAVLRGMLSDRGAKEWAKGAGK